MGSVFQFGQFRLHPTRRCLRRNDAPVAMTSRALDTLIVLVHNAGRVVSKDELIASVWDDVVVGENNLSQQISTIRKVLADDGVENRYIDTVPRKGYCFVADVVEARDGKAAAGSRKHRGRWIRR